MDPIPILSAVSTVTKNLGLAATMSTTYLEPYNLARTMASLDHVSGGRAAWNIVTAATRTTPALQREVHAPHGERYERAEEFVDVVRGIWDSYDDDAFPRDKESGSTCAPTRCIPQSQGQALPGSRPLGRSRSPQGHPVLIQAGSSEPGMNISARVADIVFTSQSSLESAKVSMTTSRAAAIATGVRRTTCSSCPAPCCSWRDRERGEGEIRQAEFPDPAARRDAAACGQSGRRRSVQIRPRRAAARHQVNNAR